MTDKPPAKRRRYSPAEIDAALIVLAHYGGNTRRAGADLDIPSATLAQWRMRLYRDRYLELAEREGPKMEAIGATNAREVLLRTSHAEHRILDSLDSDELTTKETSELAGALQRISTSKGINTTKLLELTGRPTQVVQHLNPRETIQALARDLGVSIDSTAEEIPVASLSMTSTDAGNAGALTPESARANTREQPSS